MKKKSKSKKSKDNQNTVNTQELSRRHQPTKQPLINHIFKFIIVGIVVVLLLNQISRNTSVFYRKSLVLPFSLHLNKQDLYMIKGEEFHLYVFGINKRVSFSSTDFRIVGVNFNGRLFGYRTGKAFIIARVDKKILKCRVHVIDINADTLKMREGNTFRLRIKGTNSVVHWRSCDPEIASVSMFGKVKALKKGSTIIYAKVKGRTLTCNINVE